ncbi:hypothetical protein MM239_06180 [Belliella sp. DSM 111904]|uniref:Methylamine utilisation protein MauE domain-containing protein n=1 Tax=Belliella filtrata TaxID=2923435 RepID=A0ABS9UY24_9BACT|nr:MauE/DoxX family redox-associated membrane protein [Belliella filtrata]MCH7408973.1 hypothetical protein [Belliella filtrata]
MLRYRYYMISRKWIAHIILWTLIVMWTYTGVGKLVAYQSFRGAILNQPFPNAIGAYVSIIVPLVEVLLAILLINLKTRVLGFMGSIALMSAFTTYVGLVWVEAFERVPCGCAGILEYVGWEAHFYINLSLLLLAMIGLLIANEK